jgi:hypothetical protein
MTNPDLAQLSREYYDAAAAERRSIEERRQKFEQYKELLTANADNPIVASFSFQRAGHWNGQGNYLQYPVNLGYFARVERQSVKVKHVGESAVYLGAEPPVSPSIQGVAEVLYEHLEIHSDEDWASE